MIMKYCPYCGTEVHLGAASFCQECGKVLKESYFGNAEPFIIRNESKKVEERRQVEWIIPNNIGEKKENKNTYDGYYEDIVPEDGMIHEHSKFDKSMLFKIGVIIGGVFLVTVLCIILFFIL